MLRRNWQLSGKIAFITGAANGIGAATAQALAAAGARVVISDIDGEAAARTAARIGRQATAIGLDVADRAAFTDALDDVERTIGPIDVLINNAAVMPLSRLDDENDAATSLQLAVNLHAAIHGHPRGNAQDAAPRHRPHRQPVLSRGKDRDARGRNLQRHQAR